jgi:hypothetical protein
MKITLLWKTDGNKLHNSWIYQPLQHYVDFELEIIPDLKKRKNKVWINKSPWKVI